MSKFLQIATAAALIAATTVASQAKSLTPEQALERALKPENATMMKKKANASQASLAFSVTAPETTEAQVYVFSKGEGNGYVITPSDDAFPAILGYSDSGTFDAGNVPSSMKWFLENYAREIDYAQKILAKTKTVSTATTIDGEEMTPIAPLVKSHWDQNEPYNWMCPKLEIINSTQTIDNPSGCVATSMSQVMYYHKWPETGKGSNTYRWDPGYSDVAPKTLSMDFSKVTFDWDKMLDEYTYTGGRPNFTQAQGDAVAQLMLAAGISVDMNYDFQGSGAQSSDIQTALVNYFGYSKDIRYRYRDYCSSKEWESLVYDNLKQNLPVILGGHGEAGGHSFICDGYAGDHYFHINWGWSGTSDGNFLLGRLSPDDLGTGGGAGGFNSNQVATLNIRPAKDGDEGTPESAYIICDGDFVFSSFREAQSTGGETLLYSYFGVANGTMGGGFWNISNATYNGYYGVIVENCRDKNDVTDIYGIRVSNLTPQRGYRQVPAYLEGFETGVYNVYPAYTDADGNFVKMAVANGHEDHVKMYVNADGTYSFGEEIEGDPEKAADLVVTSFNYNGDVYTNDSQSYWMTFANLSEENDYNGVITFNISDPDLNPIASLELDNMSIAAGTSIPYSVSISIPAGLLPPGEYVAAFQDKYGKDIPGTFPLVIAGENPSLTSALQVESVTPVTFAPYSSTDLTFTVGNYSFNTYTAPRFGVFIFSLNGGTSLKGWTLRYSNLTIQMLRRYNLTITGLPLNLDEGNYFLKIAKYTNAGSFERWISSNIYIGVGNPVESISLAEPSVVLPVGETRQLSASYLPSNATFDRLNWTSLDPQVASVDNMGNVLGVAEGSTRVLVTAQSGKYDICDVTVEKSTAIEEIVESNATIEAVYTLSGIRVLETPTLDQLGDLAKGVYIVVTDKGSYKITK